MRFKLYEEWTTTTTWDKKDNTISPDELQLKVEELSSRDWDKFKVFRDVTYEAKKLREFFDKEVSPWKEIWWEFIKKWYEKGKQFNDPVQKWEIMQITEEGKTPEEIDKLKELNNEPI